MNQADPFLGVILHAIGGLASASFYIPFRGVRGWAWESYWLVGGIFSWLVAPWIFALVLIPNLLAVLTEAPTTTVLWTYFFGVLWGLGGLTFGLTMRYLGIALGMAMALGYCAAFGTLMPPLFDGKMETVIHSTSGLIVLSGVAICLLGIIVSGMAGKSKEREMTAEQKQAVIKEFSFTRGVAVATFCGILSACMSYGFAAGKPIADLAVAHGAGSLWQNIPVLIVVLAGGFTTNFIWCVILNIRNGTSGDYLNQRRPDPEGEASVPLFNNYVLSAIAGLTWYLQFFFYGMGTTKMGTYHFSSWTLHMASIMIFGTVWGLILSEWKGSSLRTRTLNFAGLAVLVGSTIVVGYGNYLETKSPEKTMERNGRWSASAFF